MPEQKSNQNNNKKKNQIYTKYTQNALVAKTDLTERKC